MIDGNQFVGGVTCVLGMTMLVAAWVNNAFMFQLTIPRILDQKLGRPRARGVLFLLGICFCLLGLAIMMKWVARPRTASVVISATCGEVV